MTSYAATSNGKPRKRLDAEDFLRLLQKGLDAGLYMPEEAEKMIYFAFVDDTTGLLGGKSLRHNVQTELEYMAEKRASKGISVLYFDLDRFKTFNDKYGHDGGNKVLRRFGRVLNKACRSADIKVHRPYGDEFVVILPNTDENGAEIVLKKISEEFEKTKETLVKRLEKRYGEAGAFRDHPIRELIQDIDNLYFSPGHATVKGKDLSEKDARTCADEIINGADRKMLEAKQAKGADR